MVTTIGLEEHAWTPDLRDAVTALEGDARDDSVTMLNNGEVARRLLDVTGERIQHMDDAGIDIQVLSVTTPGTQSLPPAEAVRLARDANDMPAATVSAQPSRFAAFATLPTPDPPPRPRNWNAPSADSDSSAPCSSPAPATCISTTTHSAQYSRPPQGSVCRSTFTQR
jgi:hypothetical protein